MHFSMKRVCIFKNIYIYICIDIDILQIDRQRERERERERMGCLGLWATLSSKSEQETFPAASENLEATRYLVSSGPPKLHDPATSHLNQQSCDSLPVVT